jgi:hypothetical protein
VPRERAARSMGADCVAVLESYIAFFRDGHLQVRFTEVGALLGSGPGYRTNRIRRDRLRVSSVHAPRKRRVDCSQGRWLDRNTNVSAYCPLNDGESNFLDAGTPLYRIDGVPSGERLAFHYDYGSESAYRGR